MKVVSEGPVKITRTTIDAAWKRRKADHRLVIRDRDCRGLALITNATTMAWSYSYRPRGIDPQTGRRWPNRTVFLGNPASHSPEDARRAANKIKVEVMAGGDPVADRKARAADLRRQRSAQLGRLIEDYGAALRNRQKIRGPGNPSSGYIASEQVQVRLALEVMEAEELPATSLTEAHLRRLLDATSRGSIAGKRFGAVSRFLDWCQEASHIPANPCLLVPRSRRPKPPQARSHYLGVHELVALWRSADDLREPVWRDISRFLIAIPCRRAEAATLDWTHVDFAAGEWRQPGRLTKNREPHRLHLHPLALEILRQRHQSAGRPASGFAFPAPRSGGAVRGFHSLKLVLSEKSGVVGWAWHDMRRSFATALGEAGVSEAVADAVLNHRQSATRSGVLGVYQRASRWPEQVEAMEHWGRLLAAAIEANEPRPCAQPVLDSASGDDLAVQDAVAHGADTDDEVLCRFDAECIHKLAEMVGIKPAAEKSFGDGVRSAARAYLRTKPQPTMNTLAREIDALHTLASKSDYEALASAVGTMSAEARRLLQRRQAQCEEQQRNADRVRIAVREIARARGREPATTPRIEAAKLHTPDRRIPLPAELRDPITRESAARGFLALLEVGGEWKSRNRPSGRPSLSRQSILHAPTPTRAEPRREAERHLVMWLQVAACEAGVQVPHPAHRDSPGPFARMVGEVFRLVGAASSNNAESLAVERINELNKRRRRKQDTLLAGSESRE
jgi:integrase